jgi:LAO/AO transport system kinase
VSGAKQPATDAADLAERILAGDRSALARGITLVESSRADHRESAEDLLGLLMPHTGKAVRLGLSGAPGVGKSTFTEAFGLLLTKQGHKIAVLAVDPSSQRTGGSILADKTRMELLARDANAFIRPSPSGGNLGGVARRTREAMLLTEAAGFDVVLVETVGVGQSETAVADMVDMFLLLISPGAGDELQGIKRGIMELADLVLVNKADGDLLSAARRSAIEYQAALHLMRRKSEHWTPSVLLMSALKKEGLEAVWQAVQQHLQAGLASGERDANRRTQMRTALWSEIREGLLGALKLQPGVEGIVSQLEAQVEAGEIPPSAAARKLIGLVFGGK